MENANSGNLPTPVLTQQRTPAEVRSGVLHYLGPPVPFGGLVVFDNLPKARLKFSFDHAAWQPTIKINADGTKKITLISLIHGLQTRCDVGWEISE